MLFQRNSTPTGQDFGPRISAHFVDFSDVFQRTVIAVSHIGTRAISLIFHWFYNEIRPRRPSFQNLAFSLILLMLFQRNEMPAEHPPDFAFSICFPIEIDRNRCAADQPPGFSISMILLMLFHRNFVSTDFKQAPMGISFLEGTIRPLGCANFVDFLTVFQRNESKSAARICRLPIWPFRWYS